MVYCNDGYDKKDKFSIETYAQKMVGKTFLQIIEEDTANYMIRESNPEYRAIHENRKRKGGLGEIIEERFFHYKANNDSAPDFEEAKVELKTTPYKVNKNNTKSAKERLVLTMIDYHKVIKEKNFESSHFWYKSETILLVYYRWLEDSNRLNYPIDYVKLFTPPAEDLKIIKDDYNKIIKKIKEGKAHELSESDTMYLSACTKSSDSSITRLQPNSDIPAKPRAFAYKTSYMTYVLNHYIINGRTQHESIIKDKQVADFEAHVCLKIEKYKGKSFDELCAIFGYNPVKKPKNIASMLTFRMLGVKSNDAEEFVKAGVKIKTVRIGKNGKIKEHMSFPAFKFKNIAKQSWEESDLFELLNETKFLFVVYQENGKGEFILDFAKFWNMPNSVLENQVRETWSKTKEVLNNPPEQLYFDKSYLSIFPKKSENPVCHVRPHGRNSRDTDILPDGREYPKQCFWLNNSYILSVIKDTN